MKSKAIPIDLAKKAARAAEATAIRIRFAQKCVENNLMPPVFEHRFHPKRLWRMDYAWPESKVALEVDGGIWINGGHNRGAQIVKTWEKENRANVMGWHILKCEPKTLMSEQTINLLKEAMPKPNVI